MIKQWHDQSAVQRLESLYLLREKKQDPLQDDSLIINVVKVHMRRPDLTRHGSRRTPRRTVYFTLDHRRLHCMREAGRSELHARSCRSELWVSRANWRREPSARMARTIRADGPRGPSARTVRADCPRGRSALVNHFPLYFLCGRVCSPLPID